MCQRQSRLSKLNSAHQREISSLGTKLRSSWVLLGPPGPWVLANMSNKALPRRKWLAPCWLLLNTLPRGSPLTRWYWQWAQLTAQTIGSVSFKMVDPLWLDLPQANQPLLGTHILRNTHLVRGLGGEFAYVLPKLAQTHTRLRRRLSVAFKGRATCVMPHFDAL